MIDGGARVAPLPAAGARWVERYLLPLLAAHLPSRPGSVLSCLQVEPRDEDEAIQLRHEGHVCHVVLCDVHRVGERPWQARPVIANPARLPFATGRYDFVWTGAFGRLAQTAERRRAFGRELARVCRPSGAVMLTAGNRSCPIDLSDNASRLHGPSSPTLVDFHEMEEILIGDCGFSRLSPLSLQGMFSWSTIPGALKIMTFCLERYLRWVSAPNRPRVYASPLNPMFALWLTR